MTIQADTQIVYVGELVAPGPTLIGVVAPPLAGVAIMGDPTAAAGGGGGGGGGSTYRFDQAVAATVWSITHNLGQYPAVSVTVGGVEVDADVQYLDANRVQIAFTVAVTGSAYLNY